MSDITPNDAPDPAQTPASSTPPADPIEQTQPPTPSPVVEPVVRPTPAMAGAVPLELPDLASLQSTPPDSQGLDLLGDVELNVKIELGRAQMLIEEVLKLAEGSVVELDKLAGDPVDVLVNDRLVARGEVLVLNDNFCVRISEIVEGAKDEKDAPR
jgi:flagellar motor switch protein FliN/FliY